MGENTVSAKNQLRYSETVSYYRNGNEKCKILIAGNSIVHHGPKVDIVVQLSLQKAYQITIGIDIFSLICLIFCAQHPL